MTAIIIPFFILFTDQTMPSIVAAVLRLLGNIEEVQIFIKYRKLLKDQPWNHSFKDKYDIALAKVLVLCPDIAEKIAHLVFKNNQSLTGLK
jgi:hypothetical protein